MQRSCRPYFTEIIAYLLQNREFVFVPPVRLKTARSSETKGQKFSILTIKKVHIARLEIKRSLVGPQLSIILFGENKLLNCSQDWRKQKYCKKSKNIRGEPSYNRQRIA